MFMIRGFMAALAVALFTCAAQPVAADASIIALSSAKCLQVDGELRLGARVVQAICDGSPAQNWRDNLIGWGGHRNIWSASSDFLLGVNTSQPYPLVVLTNFSDPMLVDRSPLWIPELDGYVLGDRAYSRWLSGGRLNGRCLGRRWNGPAGSEVIFLDDCPANVERFAMHRYEPASDAPLVNGSVLWTGSAFDRIEVQAEEGVIASDSVEFVLNAGNSVLDTKELVLAEGPAAGSGRWTLATDIAQRSNRNGLYAYQLAGGAIFLRSRWHGELTDVRRIPLDAAKPGSRLTFNWLRDGSNGPFADGSVINTSDGSQIAVRVEDNAVAADSVEFVLEAAEGVDWRKEIELLEGPSAGNNRWTIWIEASTNTNRNGLYLYQLPGGVIRFRRWVWFENKIVHTLPLDSVRPGSRTILTWLTP